MLNRLVPSAILVFAAPIVFAQTPAPTEFEVASVRLNTANDRIVTINVGPGGRFAARGYTLVLLMQRAYGVMDWNVTGGPGWIRTDRYDVLAKADVSGNLPEKQLKPMLQSLLAERFKLKLHHISKEMSGYALVAAKGGPKLKASADGKEHSDTFRMGGNGLSGQGITMADFARFVAGKLGVVAVDKTVLLGVYDVKVDWQVDTDPSDDPREAMRAAAFAAIQDRLGLKFSAQKIAVPMLVIDSVEKASEN
ncbi:MAG TPA: TIGR03435 family protein [Bryobacteraceae bacterium]|nr:TIGR03435 family protein [Bryobacteraceae bacterium]